MSDVESATALPSPRLLGDIQMRDFLVQGYHLTDSELPAKYHADVCAHLESLFQRRGNPGNEVLEEVPDLERVWNAPTVTGALTSILGPDYTMHPHRHCHASPPGMRGQQWHQDDVNKRHHQVWRLLAMYYPQDVTLEMGPTQIVPGTQFRNTPTSRMAAYGSIKTQVSLTVPAGTVAITHYDIWHRATHNRSEKTRYMLKFLFDRSSPPDRPAWNAGSTTGEELLESFNRIWLPIDSQTDAYKHRVIWMNCWKWWHGTPPQESCIVDHFP